jgi:hypothetical protein
MESMKFRYYEGIKYCPHLMLGSVMMHFERNATMTVTVTMFLLSLSLLPTKQEKQDPFGQAQDMH